MNYRGEKKGLQVLLSYSQAEPGRIVKQEQEEISRNPVQAFILGSVPTDPFLEQKKSQRSSHRERERQKEERRNSGGMNEVSWIICNRIR